jgi:integrase
MAPRKVPTTDGVRWETRPRGADGREHRKRFKTATEAREFERTMANQRAAARRGEYVPSENPPLREWCDRFLDSHTVRPQTLEALRYRLNVICKTFGDDRLQDLTRERIGRWVNRDLDDYSPTSIKLMLKAFRQVLHRAVRDGLLARNEAAEVALPSMARPPIRPFASYDEVERVADHAGEWGGMIRFAAATGLRLQELRALRWSDIDAENRRLTISRAVQNKRIEEGEAKTGRSLRTITLSRRALDALPERAEAGALIFGEDGDLLKIDRWRRTVWTDALKDAGVAYRPPKHLRHSFATLQISKRQPMPIQEVSALLGHSDIKTTMDFYAGKLPGQDAHIAAMLDAD